MIGQFSLYIKRFEKLDLVKRLYFPMVDSVITISGLHSIIDFNINFPFEFKDFIFIQYLNAIYYRLFCVLFLIDLTSISKLLLG